MKHMILFEQEDLSRLKAGETITLAVGGAEVLISYARSRPAKRSPSGESHACEQCDRIFDSTRGVAMHVMRVHAKKGRAR